MGAIAAATTLGYDLQFYPYAGKDSSYNKDIGRGGSVIMNLSKAIEIIERKWNCCTGTLRANRTENTPLIAIYEMKEVSRGISDAANDNKYNVTLVRWKDNKVVTVPSTLYEEDPMKRASRYIKDKGGRVYIDQSNATSVYNRHMVGVDRLDQNISNYMINL
ncbi:unnamed protein product [Lepeophtheirus salmonis]|uniref:(salmon louse) hypothetical protein n=1 Tax=Lepeophtheirus salmonis TaxID=72036 RepID=A0A7R8CS96_LEPSM|nr:unnamed protein product [Lepeophtheirus salmonis]CAF2914729.1 unnamed protein product [Lepeophtheirus salmonis]